MKRKIDGVKIDHNAPFVIRTGATTQLPATWFRADVHMEDQVFGVCKAVILVEITAFAEYLGFECNDPVAVYDEVFPTIIDDGEAIDVEDWLESHEDKLIKFLADDKQFENQTWVVA